VAMHMPLLAPVDPPTERSPKTDGHVGMEPIDGQARRAAVLPKLDQGHPGEPAGERFLKAPAEGERILAAEVIQGPFPAVDIDFVVAFHDVIKALEGRVIGNHTELPAEEMSGSCRFEKQLGSVFEQAEGCPPIGRMEIPICLVPSGDFFPLHVAVVGRIPICVVTQEHPRPFFERHDKITIVAPGGAFDEFGAEVHAPTVAAVTEKIRERGHHRRGVGVVEPDLQDDAAGEDIRRVVPGGMDVADDPGPGKVGHRDPRSRIERFKLRIAVEVPAGVGKSGFKVVSDFRRLGGILAADTRAGGRNDKGNKQSRKFSGGPS
jgi:hypothetical protein